MPILVTGATGNVGRRVVDELIRAGASVRALTINPRKAALPPEVEVVEGHLGRLDAVAEAVAGVERMYLAPLPATVRDVVALAEDAHVRRVVDLSAYGAELEASAQPGQWHFYAVEQAVEHSAVEWTHLRPGEFMTNTLAWADQIRSTGVVRGAYATSANAAIDLDDIAAVAARALLEDGHAGNIYQLTGPEALTQAQLARLIGDAIGREVRFEELTPDAALAELTVRMGERAARWYLEGLAQMVDHPLTPTRTVEHITGRPATTFAAWARKHADAFR
jgi:uncharacterized protein YbjT (DUF2867 family)